LRLSDETAKYQEHLVELRREFHRHPDMTGHEEPTINRIAAHMERIGIPYEIVRDGGLLAYIYGTGFEPEAGKEPWQESYVEDGDKCLFNSSLYYGPEGTEEKGAMPAVNQTWKMKTVMLRADVDALPVEEDPENLKGPKVCVSENKGICHACGHDAHIAMQIGAAEYLFAHRNQIAGRVILMFERGEEGPNNVIHLYRHMIRKNIHVDTAYGTHIYYALESGRVAVQPGPVMGGGVFYRIRLIGRGGHGSRPDMAANPIDCYVALMNGLNEFRMKHVDPFHALTYAPTMVKSGAVDNVIPGDLQFSGNVRLYELEDGVKFKKYFYDLLDRVCPTYGCRYEIDYCIGPKVPVKNDVAIAKMAKTAVAEAVGAENVCEVEPWMACESFCTTLAMVPGIFTFLGMKNPEKGSGALHHSAKFDIDEDVLSTGMAAAVSFAFGFLNGDTAPAHGWFAGGLAELYDISGYGDEKVTYLRDGGEFTIVEGKR